MEGTEDVRESLIASNSFFKSMVDLVPPAFYFDKDVTKQLYEERTKHMEVKLKGIKKGGDMSDKAKLRRAKFDPSENKKVTELASQMVDDENSDVESRGVKASKISSSSSNSKQRLSLEELRDKLRNRIEELRGRRHGVTADEFLEKKRLRRKESKVKLKIKKKTERETISSGKQAKNETSKSSMIHNGAPPVKEESKIAFSKFEFSGDSNAKSRPKAGSKNFKVLLQKAEQEQQHLAQLKATDSSKAAELESKQLWTAALDKAKGVKVKNDPALLKKSVKLQEKKKEKSRKEWQDRHEAVENRKQERQDKRAKNIKARKLSNIDKKVKKSRMKGRLVSGF